MPRGAGRRPRGVGPARRGRISRIPIGTRNFRLFLIYRITTRVLLFVPFIQLFMVKVRHLSEAQYGALQSLYYVVVVVAEVPSGVLADRIGRKAILVLGAAVNGLGCFLFALAHDVWAFAAGEVLFALGTALISGADSALLYDSLAADRRESEYPRAEGAAQAAWLAVTVASYPLAGLLVTGGDPVAAYWVTGGLCLLGAGVGLCLVEPPAGPPQSTREITAGALRDLATVPGVTRLLAYSVAVFALLRGSVVMFFHPVLEASGVPAPLYGTVVAAMNLAGALAAWRAHGWLKRWGQRAVMVAMPLSMLYMFLLLGLVRAPWAALFFCIQGSAFGVYPLLTRSILNRLVPSARRRATVLSLDSFACRLAFAPLALFAGRALDRIGLDAALAATALLACLPFLALPLLRRDRGSAGHPYSGA